MEATVSEQRLAKRKRPLPFEHREYAHAAIEIFDRRRLA
jgi:hypothetical protein